MDYAARFRKLSGQFFQYNDPKWNLIRSVSEPLPLNVSGIVHFRLFHKGSPGIRGQCFVHHPKLRCLVNFQRVFCLWLY